MTDTAVPPSRRRTKMIERRVSALYVLFKSLERNASGETVEVVRTADRGELVSLPLAEAARLDGLGALAPEGWTAQDIQDDLKRLHAEYTSGRQRAADDGSVF